MTWVNGDAAGRAHTGPKNEGRTVMDQAQVLRSLAKRRAELADRLARIRRDRRRADGPLPQDFADQATARENDDVLDRLEQATAEDLAQFDRALRHAQAGEYGVCERCGNGISASRLQALPQATLCADCAAARSGAQEN
ncbi:TraR/DksA C4-type zinc finger protein [Fontimonas sp. SYSU GA230001]|uniref:TraR/DksA family transcriptional regulator n=1 Tax=Fontimonas sp. SYSU GA230001 TaxID=3142450 RepID=UPI0032B4FDA9